MFKNSKNEKSNFDYFKKEFYDYFGYDVSDKIYNEIYSLESYIQISKDSSNLFDAPSKLIGFRYISELLHNSICKKLQIKKNYSNSGEQRKKIREKIDSKYFYINNTLETLNKLGIGAAHLSEVDKEKNVLLKKTAIKILKEIKLAFDYLLDIKKTEKFNSKIYEQKWHKELMLIKKQLENEIKEIKESNSIIDESFRNQLIEIKKEKARNIMLEDSIKELTTIQRKGLIVDESIINNKLSTEEIQKIKTIKDSVVKNQKRKEKIISDLEKQLEK